MSRATRSIHSEFRKTPTGFKICVILSGNFSRWTWTFWLWPWRVAKSQLSRSHFWDKLVQNTRENKSVNEVNFSCKSKYIQTKKPFSSRAGAWLGQSFMRGVSNRMIAPGSPPDPSCVVVPLGKSLTFKPNMSSRVGPAGPTLFFDLGVSMLNVVRRG